MSTAHKEFTVDGTAYMRSLTRDELNNRWLAVHYQAPPVDKGNGCRSISMRFPMMLMVSMLEDGQAVANRVAAILNDHWHDEKYGEAGK